VIAVVVGLLSLYWLAFAYFLVGPLSGLQWWSFALLALPVIAFTSKSVGVLIAGNHNDVEGW